MTIPSYTIRRSRKTDRERFAAWLAEREIDLVLRDRVDPVQAAGLRYDRKKWDGAIETGDVLLLKPAGGWTPVYVLAVEASGDSDRVVVPFGRYATPAVPGEWGTGLKAAPLRVLCFWNVLNVTSDQFIGGPVKRLSARQFADAVTVYRHVLHGDELSDRLAKRLGPPIVHPADPRYAYLEEERERLADHVKSVAVPDGEIILFEESGANWLMAAEGRPGYGEKK